MIGIVILNYKNWKDTRRCIESISRNPPKDSYQIILVDNASKNRPEYDLASLIQRHQILFMQNKKNLGYNAGNNVGIAKACELNCSHILISNSDVRYFPGSIQHMADYLTEHPQAGIVGPKILDRRGQVQKSCLCRKTGLKEKYLVRTKANLFFRKSYQTYFGMDRDYNQTFPAYAVLGCCFMMSRQCALAVTPLDEHPFLYEEELILGMHMQQAGFATVYDPQAVIRHLHGGSTRYQRAEAFLQNVCSEIYYCRHYLKAAAWQVWPLYAYRTVLYLLRCVRQEDFRKGWKRYVCRTRAEWKQMQLWEKKSGRRKKGL